MDFEKEAKQVREEICKMIWDCDHAPCQSDVKEEEIIKKALQSAYEKGQESRWLKYPENRPDNDSLVIVRTKAKTYEIDVFINPVDEFDVEEGYSVTHFMPIQGPK